MESDYFLTRHSLKPNTHEAHFKDTTRGDSPEDEKYKGISQDGVELARERARTDLLKYLEQQPKDAVIWIGGSSNQIRTKSTARVYGNELKNILANDDRYIVITEDDLQGVTDKIQYVQELIKNNQDKKVIIDIPLYMKEFNIALSTQGNNLEVLKSYTTGMSTEKDMLDKWYKENGGGVLISPEEAGKKQDKGFGRLEDFARKIVGKDRPLVIGTVGHSANSDAYITQQAGKKHYSEIDQGRGLIGDTEIATIKKRDGETEVNYRGKEYRNKEDLS
jgi:hypothetical protein